MKAMKNYKSVSRCAQEGSTNRLAQFAREPVSKNLKAATARRFALGETINSNLDKVRALADGVLLEFGRSREQDVALRDRIRQWQPQLRMLFIRSIVIWKYRAQLPGFELPEWMKPAQEEFDNSVATVLDGVADRLEGHDSSQKEDLTASFTRLHKAVLLSSSSKAQTQITPQVQSFLLLSRQVASLAASLDKQI